MNKAEKKTISNILIILISYK